VASVHVFSSQEGAETIPRAGVVFYRVSERLSHRPKGIPLVDQRTEICVISLKIFISGVRETEMIADPKRKPYQDDGDGDKRRRQEEALDEALEKHLSGVRSGFSRAADDERARLSFLT
jgi:hypothetical protein